MSRARVEMALIAALFVHGTLHGGARAVAVVEPFVNLGFTSFVDGFGDPTDNGLAIVQYFRFAHSGTLKGPNGDDAVAFRDPTLNAAVSVTQLLYTFKRPEGFPGWPAISLLVPIVNLDASFAAGGATLVDNGLGVGDVFLGPALQLPPVMSGEHPVFFNRFEFDVMIPVGKYDIAKQLNQGNNAWALNPFWAATVLAGPLVEVSWRLHYLYNFENADPVTAPPGLPLLSTTKAGQAVHLNLAASIEVLPKALRVGLSTYFFRQITESQENGVGVPDSEEQVLGLGPGLVWFPSRYDLVFLNAYFETATRNRFQGNSVQIRWGHAFATF